MRVDDLVEMQYELRGFSRMLTAAQSNHQLPGNARHNMLDAKQHINDAEHSLQVARILIEEAQEQAGAV